MPNISILCKWQEGEGVENEKSYDVLENSLLIENGEGNEENFL